MVNQKVWMGVSIEGKDAGRMVFELFSDLCPKTCQNFVDLCTGAKGKVTANVGGKPKEVDLRFANSLFHRIIPNFMAQGGDITDNNGKGGWSIYGKAFPDENFIRKHVGPGALAMANSGPNTNGSQFYVSFIALPWLDNKHVVFGQLADGADVLKLLESLGTPNGKPKKAVKIYGAGLL